MNGERARARRWVAAYSLAVAVLVVLPSLLMWHHRAFYASRFPEIFRSWPQDGSFSPIDSHAMMEDSYSYAGRIRDAAEHALPGDPHIRENRTLRTALRDFLAIEAFALVYRVAGGPRSGWLLSQFLFTLLWVPCLYLVLRRSGAARAPSLFGAVVITLFADLARALILDGRLHHVLVDAVQYMFWFLGSYHYFFGPSRVTGPLLTYPCLLFAGLAFVRAQEKRNIGRLAAAGLAGGLLSYVHSDVWLAFAGASGLFVLSLAMETRRLDPRAVLPLAVAGAAALPWLALGRPNKEELEVLGIIPGRAPSLGTLPLLLGAALAWRARETPMTRWLACLLASMVLAGNSQVVLGWTLGQGHWHYIGNIALALVAAAALAKRIPWERKDWLWAAGLACALALPRAVSYAAQHFKFHALDSGQEQAYAWLERNAPKDAVVAALNPAVEYRLPVYAGSKTVRSFLFPGVSDIPAAENARRIVYQLSLYGVKLEDYLRYGLDESGGWARKLWTGQVDDESRDRSGLILSFQWLEGYRDLLARAAAEPLQDFKADYLWFGRFERALVGEPARLPRRACPRKVYENHAVALYALGCGS